MVLQNPFDREKSPSFTESSTTKLASPQQRLLATTIDLLVFAPIISLCLAGVYKNLKMQIFLDEFSAERTELWILWISSYYLLWVLLTSCFLYFRQATPGAEFVRMRLWTSRGKPSTLTAIFVRQLAFPFHILFLGTTLFEIYFHDKHRAFHDKLSETQWLSLYENELVAPNQFEKKFTLSIFKGFFVLVALAVGISLFAKFEAIKNFSYSHKKNLEDTPKCAKALASGATSEVSELIFLNQTKLLSDACLKNEIDFLLYSLDEDHEKRAWAYFALATLSSEKSEKEDYERMACEAKSQACELIQFRMSKSSEAPNSLKKDPLLKYYQILRAKSDHHFAEAYRIFQDLQLRETKDFESLRLSILIEWAHSKLASNPKQLSRQPSSMIESAPRKANESEDALFWQEWDDLRRDVKL